MNNIFDDILQASSAKRQAEIKENMRIAMEEIQAENIHKHKVGEATIELNEQTKKQNEILKAQLVEVQKTNNLLVQQAEDSAKSARLSLIVAIVSLVVTVASVLLSIVVL